MKGIKSYQSIMSNFPLNKSNVSNCDKRILQAKSNIKFEVYRGKYLGRANKSSVFSMEPMIAQKADELQELRPQSFNNLNTLGADDHKVHFINAYTDASKQSNMSNTSVCMPAVVKSIRSQRSESLLRPKFNIRQQVFD